MLGCGDTAPLILLGKMSKCVSNVQISWLCRGKLYICTHTHTHIVKNSKKRKNKSGCYIYHMPKDYLWQVVNIANTGLKCFTRLRTQRLLSDWYEARVYIAWEKYRLLKVEHFEHVFPAMLQGVKRSKKPRNVKVQWTAASESVSLIVTASINQSNLTQKHFT
jgi:hypothetical protein